MKRNKPMTDLLTRIENNQPIEAQELYDFVVAAIVKQGRPSVGDNDRCLYRGPDGLKCAVGHVIPDGVYSPVEMENQDILGLRSQQLLPKSLIPHAGLLCSLQVCHDGPSSFDGFTFIKAFCHNANEVAERYNLKPHGENT
jgi:hypothetical protein